jgi:Yip1 domain
MSVPTPIIEATPPPPPMSQPAMIVNTFIAPTKTFQAIRQNASWWMAWLLMAIVSYGFIYTMDKKIGFEQITQTEIARSSRAAQFDAMPQDQKEKQMDFAVKLTRGISYSIPIFTILAYLVVAAVLMGTFNFGLGTQVPFKRALAITVYGFLPSLIGALMGILGMIAVNPEGFNSRNPIASNPAYFMDPNAHKSLYVLASALDIFSLWTVVLLGIGFAVNSKVKRSTAIMVVLGWYLLVKLVAAGFAGLG